MVNNFSSNLIDVVRVVGLEFTDPVLGDFEGSSQDSITASRQRDGLKSV